ncbi:MAG: type II secretion system protein [Planctomycetes bacterium]|nr:type II secretion system protein [Planctomycetota bacterium]
MTDPSDGFAAHADNSTERGSSLVELVIGTSIVTTILIALISAVTRQSRLRKVDEEVNLAMIACRNALEELRDMPFSSLASLHDSGFDIPGTNGGPHGLAPLANDDDGLPGHFAVVVDQSSSGEILYRVTLAVDWSGSAGKQHFELSTLVAERKA